MKRDGARFIFLGTFGQTALLVSAALLLAQTIGFFLLVNERDRWRLLDAIQPAVERFVNTAEQIARAAPGKRSDLSFELNRPEQHVMLAPLSAVSFLHLTRERDLEEKLSAALARAGIAVKAVEASSIGFANSPPENKEKFPPGVFFFARFGPPPYGKPGTMGYMRGPMAAMRLPVPPGGSRDGPVMVQGQAFGGGMPDPPPGDLHGGPPGMPRPPFGMMHAGGPFDGRDGNRQEIDLSAQLRDGTWVNAQYMSIRPSSAFMRRLVFAEFFLFASVLAVTLMLAWRLSRPLALLASASDLVGPDRLASPVKEMGTRDVRAAIRSFNAMTSRVADLLREKDRMLGAIGHDLRTPLASLRIRAESIEPEAEREKIIETVDDMTRMVDEILDLVRLGRSGERSATIDLTALADALVEEYRELGREVTFLDSPRAVLRVQPALVKRLLRNLIENALKFGERARVSVALTDDAVTISIADDGPGIPPEDLARVLEPFTRLEASRSRETGGIGIGLSIADSLAKSQGASLVLENAPFGGLIARVIWALESAEPAG